jgi:tetratricopeptide (TPR) repeat protein
MKCDLCLRAFTGILFFFSLSSAQRSDTALVLSGSLADMALQVTEYTMSCEYEKALITAKKIRTLDPGVSCVLENIVRISQFDDRGDTVAIKQANLSLQQCRAYGLWDALREFELGYTKSTLGSSINGALLTRSAAASFKSSKDMDAQAFYSIYAYYVDDNFGWLPFVTDERNTHLGVLHKASEKSVLFWPLFVTPLVWMHYDREEYQRGLELFDQALLKAPGHPVFLQMKADMLYRMKRYGDAAFIYEQSAQYYEKVTGKSIRYWCAVANLIRIYHDQKNEVARNRWQKRLRENSFKAIRPWMPSSLMNDLAEKKLL